MRENTVAFFETEAQLQALLRESAAASHAPALVALTPEADYAAERRGLSYHTIEDLYSEEDLLQKGLENFARAEGLCDTFDERFLAAFAALAGEGVFSARYYLYYIKRLLDNLLHCALTLDCSLKSLQPSRILCFEALSLPPSDELWFVGESLWQRVLPHVAQHHGLEIVRLPAVYAEQDSPSRHSLPGPTLQHWKHRSTAALLGGRHALQTLWRLRMRKDLSQTSRSTHGDPATVIVAQAWPDLEIVRRDPAARGLRFVELRELMAQNGEPGPTLTGDSAKIEALSHIFWTGLKADDAFRSYFQFDGVDLFAVAEDRLRHFTLDMVPRHMRLAARFEPVLRLLPAPVVISAFPNGVEDLACFAAARRLAIPTISHQHGGFNGYFEYPMLRYTELHMAVDYHFCYGGGVTSYVEKLLKECNVASDGGPRPVPVGSAALDTLHFRMRQRGPESGGVERTPVRRVVYVPTFLIGNLRYFSWHLLPDIYYWRLQTDVIRLCCQFPDTHVLVKLYPKSAHLKDMTPSPLESWVHEQGFNNCELISELPFVETLGMGDLFIIDSAATTLLQAITTTKPVIVFADQRFMHLCPEAAELLKKRVHLSTTREGFLDDIARILQENGGPLPQPPNDEFLEKYGTMDGNGRSAERTVNGILRIARERLGASSPLSQRHGSNPN